MMEITDLIIQELNHCGIETTIHGSNLTYRRGSYDILAYHEMKIYIVDKNNEIYIDIYKLGIRIERLDIHDPNSINKLIKLLKQHG